MSRPRPAPSSALASALFSALALAVSWSPAVRAQLVADLAAPDGALRVQTRQVEIAPPDGDGFVPVRFQPSEVPSLLLGSGAKHWNWSGASELRMHLQNAMAWPVTVQFRVTDAGGGTLDAAVGLPPGGPLTFSLPLQATQPRRWGMVAGPPIPWMQEQAPVAVALATAGQVDKRRIASLSIAMPKPAAQQTLRIGKVFVEPAAAGSSDQERLAYTGIVDAYGQYTRGKWDEKYSAGGGSFAAFAHSRELPPAPVQASGAAPAEKLDRYGGLADIRMPALEPLSTARSAAASPATMPAIAAAVKPAATASATPAAGAPAGRFFRTAKVRGAAGAERWLLLTPEGNPFFSLGINAIQLDNSQTFVEGREFMFTQLPQKDAELGRFYGAQDSADALPLDAGAQRGRGYGKGRTYDFYRANLYRRDGDDYASRWLDRTRERLKRWRFNTIGSWSDRIVSEQARIPYTRTIHVAGDFSKLSDGKDWWAGIADPFDPRFAQALERAVGAEAAPLRDDPFLIGYFVDNELGWGNGAAAEPQSRYALAYSALGGDAGQPHDHAKRALLALLRSRYKGSIDALSKSWQRPFASWDELNPPLAADKLPDGTLAAAAADLSAFLRLHAQRYFEQVAAAIERHDPNHLYLGARFASRTPEALEACARWCDVVSFNLYLPSIDIGFEAAAFRRLDKPALLTEFHFASSDRGPFWHGVMPVPAEAERGPAYERMLASVLANPDFVGAHWFQYLDQPVTGRWLDGENGHLGLVAITDIPWGGFVAQVSAANQSLQQQLGRQLEGR